MNKRRPALDESQLAFSFTPPAKLTSEGALAGIDRVIASAVAQILKNEPRNRFEVAAAMAAVLDEDVSKQMLDGYASEARDNHNISMARFAALVAVTHRYDALAAVVRLIGCTVLVGEQVYLAEIGHLEAEERGIKARLKALKATAQPIQGAK